MNKEEIRQFKALLRQGILRHRSVLLDAKFQSELLNIIKGYEHLEQQCKKQQKVIDKANKKLNNFIDCCKAEKLESGSDYIHHQYWDMFERFNKQIKDILKEVSEWK